MGYVVEKRVIGALLCMMGLGSIIWESDGAVHKVGDSGGWSSIANIDYKQWALPRTFHLGDVIVFEYNPKFHNVMRVSHDDYRTCNASNPISSYTTGNDSITITTRGHHLFICGVPAHCHAGQKVDINVPQPPSTTPPLTPPSASAPAPAPAPATGASPPLNISLPSLLLLLFFPILYLFY